MHLVGRLGCGVTVNIRRVVGELETKTENIRDLTREPNVLDDAGDTGHAEDEKAACHLSTCPEKEGSDVVHFVGLLRECDGSG